MIAFLRICGFSALSMILLHAGIGWTRWEYWTAMLVSIILTLLGFLEGKMS